MKQANVFCVAIIMILSTGCANIKFIKCSVNGLYADTIGQVLNSDGLEECRSKFAERRIWQAVLALVGSEGPREKLLCPKINPDTLVCSPEKTLTLRNDTFLNLDGRKSSVSGPGNENFNPRNIRGGDVICLKSSGGATSYGIRISNLTSLPGASGANPVTFVNYVNAGQVLINGTGEAGFWLRNSRYICVDGGGDRSQTYGFKIDGTFPKGVKISERSSDVSIARLEISGVSSAGIQSTPRGNCSDASRPQGQSYDDMYDFDNDGFYQKGRVMENGAIDPGDLDDVISQANFTLYNILIHHNYIHDVGTEGMYIGSNRSVHMYYPDGTPGPAQGARTICNYTDFSVNPPIIATGDNDPLSPKQVGVEIYSNIVDRSGWDSINVKSSARDCNIYDNTITNFATANNQSDQIGAINITPDVNCNVYRNTIKDGNGAGIYSMGSGGIIAHNLIIRSGQNGIAGHAHTSGITLTSTSLAWPELYYGHSFQVFNNTIIAPHHTGIRFSVKFESSHRLVNNLVVNSLVADPNGKSKSIYVDSDSTVALKDNNFYEESQVTPGFIDKTSDNFCLGPTSPFLDRGLDLANFLAGPAEILNLDLLSLPRPANGAFDIGACELQP